MWGSLRLAPTVEKHTVHINNSYADIKHIHVHLILTLSLWSFSHDNNSSLLHTMKCSLMLSFPVVPIVVHI